MSDQAPIAPPRSSSKAAAAPAPAAAPALPPTPVLPAVPQSLVRPGRRQQLLQQQQVTLPAGLAPLPGKTIAARQLADRSRSTAGQCITRLSQDVAKLNEIVAQYDADPAAAAEGFATEQVDITLIRTLRDGLQTLLKPLTVPAPAEPAATTDQAQA